MLSWRRVWIDSWNDMMRWVISTRKAERIRLQNYVIGKGTSGAVSQEISMDAVDGYGGIVGVYFDDSRPGVDRRGRRANNVCKLIPNLHFLNYSPFSLPLSVLISC